MSNYPPGVSGFEDEIAGPWKETTGLADRTCDMCGFEGEMQVTTEFYSDHKTIWYECPMCTHEGDETEDYDREDDEYDD